MVMTASPLPIVALLPLIVIEITLCDPLLQGSVAESLLMLTGPPAHSHHFFSLLLITVLPKFEVQVKMPKTIGFLDDEFVVSVCSL